MQVPPMPAATLDNYAIGEAIGPITRKQSLKLYSKGDLIRYAMELEERVNQLIERERQHG